MCDCKKEFPQGFCPDPECPLLLPFQRQFIDSRSRVTILLGGIGCGKSVAAMAAADQHESILHLPRDEGFKYRRSRVLNDSFPCDRLRGLSVFICDDFDMLKPLEPNFPRLIAAMQIKVTARSESGLIPWLMQLPREHVTVITASIFDNPYASDDFKQRVDKWHHAYPN